MGWLPCLQRVVSLKQQWNPSLNREAHYMCCSDFFILLGLNKIQVNEAYSVWPTKCTCLKVIEYEHIRLAGITTEGNLHLALWNRIVARKKNYSYLYWTCEENGWMVTATTTEMNMREIRLLSWYSPKIETYSESTKCPPFQENGYLVILASTRDFSKTALTLHLKQCTTH